jgi:hypothetical protein
VLAAQWAADVKFVNPHGSSGCRLPNPPVLSLMAVVGTRQKGELAYAPCRHCMEVQIAAAAGKPGWCSAQRGRVNNGAPRRPFHVVSLELDVVGAIRPDSAERRSARYLAAMEVDAASSAWAA